MKSSKGRLFNPQAEGFALWEIPAFAWMALWILMQCGFIPFIIVVEEEDDGS